MSEPIDRAYLDGLYDSAEDPWNLRTGWYELRKRQIVMSSLLKPRYDSVFEPGCAVGELTGLLAERADQVLAADFNERAVRLTRARVQDLPQVQVDQLLLPDQWPTNRSFDLIVLSEIGYFLSPPAWRELCRLTATSARPDTTVVACHWRGDFAERTAPTTELHEILGATLGWPRTVSLVDEDFVLEVWSNQAQSIAQAQRLR